MNPNKRSVLFLSSWYPNRTAPTFGIFVQRQAVAVSKYNKVSVLYAIADPSLSDKIFDLQINKTNDFIEVIVYYKKVQHSIPLLSSILKFYRFFIAYLKGYRQIKFHNGRPDLLHLNVIFPAGIIALFLNYLYKIPFVISEHWSGYLPEDNSYKGRLLKWISLKAVSKAKAVLVVSDKMKQAMLSHGLKNTYHIVPNVVDTHVFYPNKDKNSLPIKMVHVSSLVEREKNVSGILRTIKKLSENRQDFILEIIGNGEERAEIEAYANSLGINNRFVFFKGVQDSPAVAATMRSSDFLILFSNYETFSCVLIEAFASGIPVIATRIGGIPEIVNEKQGILVEVRNENMLFDAINTMLDSYKTYNSNELRVYAENNFSYDKVATQLDAIYTKALI